MNQFKESLGVLRALAILISAILTIPGGRAYADVAPSTGSDSIVVYNDAMEPVRRLANIPTIATCGSASGNSIAIGYYPTESIILLDHQGTPRFVKRLDEKPRRVSGYSDGFVVVTERGIIVDIDLDGKLKEYDTSHRPINAIAHPQQKAFIMVHPTGEITIASIGGQATNHYGSDNAGRNVSIRDIALEDNTNIVALDVIANEIITLDLSLRELRRTPAPFDIKEVTSIFSTSPSLTALFKDQTLVRFFRSDGSTSLHKAKNPITCAVQAGVGTIGLGTSSQSSAGAPSGYMADIDNHRPKLTATCLFAVICYALLGSLAFVYLWRKISARKRLPPAVRETDESPLSGHLSSLSRGAKLFCSLVFLIAIGGVYLSWWACPKVRVFGSLTAWGYYWLGAALSGLSLAYLGHKGLLYRGLACLQPTSRAHRRDFISWVLITLSLAAVFVTHYLIQHGLYPRFVVAAWIAGQVLFVSAFTASYRSPSWSWWERLALLALLSITFVTRVYKWLECPAEIHFDFGTISIEAVSLLYDNWDSLFDLRAGQTIARVWLLQMAASMWLFGIHEWATRLPSVIWMMGLVWACYLLGRETVSRRFGFIFGVLTIAQHNLLAYSRLPYVTESTAPFVFCLYYCCRGIKRNSLRDWSIAGMWAGWSMMTVRNFTPFPFIGAAILLCFCLFHLRVLWSQKTNLLVMAVAATVAFSPYYYFYTHAQHLSFRLAGASPLLSNLQINTDLSVWKNQMSAAFGAILRYPDRVLWPSESSDPICLALTGSFFGAGLIILLVRARSLATPVALCSMAVSIALGSGFIEGPPTYYHHFVGLVFVMYVVAIPLECLSQIVAAMRFKSLRLILGLGVFGATALAAQEQVRPFINFCGWSTHNGWNSLESRHVYSVLSERLLRRRNNIFVMVGYPQKAASFGHANCSIFYGQFSERHEVVSPMRTYLPIRPGSRSKSLEFLAFFESEYLDEIRKAYPGGIDETILYNFGQQKIFSYTVPAQQVVSTYEQSLSTGAFLDKEHYELIPQSH